MLYENIIKIRRNKEFEIQCDGKIIENFGNFIGF